MLYHLLILWLREKVVTQVSKREFEIENLLIPKDKEPFDVPDSWVWVPLYEVCFEDKFTIPPGSEQAQSLKYLGMEDVESNTGKINISGQKPGNSNTFYFNESHILYGKLRPY